ncbi:hypothetical protein [Halobaculum litoreum]|uniref:hypothetical protein n=1 Tax=Halobaculum litoreum TaxID=3031998 RepID=UPI0024C2FFB7|nr:hypothetical protein [Halobaculum sp. DT92]
MTNPNDVPVVAVVEGPNDTVERVALDPAGEANDSRRLVGLENGSYTVRTLTADGREREVGRERLAVDCPAAGDGPGLGPVETTVACDVDGDGGVLVVANPNDVPVQVVVVGPNDTDERATLGPAGEDDDRLRLDGLVNGTYTVRTLTAEDENGTEVGVEAVAVDCAPTAPDEPDEPDEPAPPVNLRPVGATADCDDDGGVLVVTNPNEVAVQVDVEGPGDTEERVTLDPAGEEDDELALDTLENGTYTVRTLTGEDENVTEVGVDTVEIACEADAGVDSDEGETGLEPADGESENGTAPPDGDDEPDEGNETDDGEPASPDGDDPTDENGDNGEEGDNGDDENGEEGDNGDDENGEAENGEEENGEEENGEEGDNSEEENGEDEDGGNDEENGEAENGEEEDEDDENEESEDGSDAENDGGEST